MNLVDVLDEIGRHLSNGRNVALEAYPGWGKTRLAAQLAASPAFKRLLIVERTIRELYEVEKFSETKLFPAYGRPSICYKMTRDTFSYRVCAFMRASGKCTDNPNHEDAAWLAARFRRVEEIRDYEMKKGRCLYSTIRMLAHKMPKVVTTYDYLIHNPSISQERDVVIYDEAHTIVNILLENSVESVDYGVLRLFTDIYRKNMELRGIAYKLRSMLRKGMRVIDILRELERMDIQYYIYSDDPDDPAYKISMAINAISRKTYYYDEESDSVYFRVKVDTIFSKYRPALFMSAYIPRIIEELANEKITVEPGERQKVYIDASLSSRYSERSSELYRRYAAKIREYARTDCPTLVITPSREFAENISKHLGVEITVSDIGNGINLTYASSPLTEGVNIPVCRVIVAGMPVPSPRPEYNVLLKAEAVNLYREIALIRTFQAVGRLRFRGDAYLLDERYANIINDMPSWVEPILL